MLEVWQKHVKHFVPIINVILGKVVKELYMYPLMVLQNKD